jgi:hypothetical protein
MAQGELWVVGTNPPVISGATAAGGYFIFSGTGGTPGWEYVVLSSTNVALPLPQWTRIQTNTFDASGNFSVTNPMDPGVRENFFRLDVSQP